jgi:hypothetical protein
VAKEGGKDRLDPAPAPAKLRVVAGVVGSDQCLDRVHRRFDVGLWHRLEHVVSPSPGWRGVLEQEPPSPGELERRAVQVTERAQPCLLVSLCGVPDDLGHENLEQLDRVVLGRRLEGMEQGDERGGPARLGQARQDSRLRALPEAGQAE